jgi:lipoprotein-releasing system ATP-binding protein
MSEPVLSLRGIARTYITGDMPLQVLKGVNLDLHPGEIVGLVGPSGSGKSSLLHSAGLLEKPSEGQVVIESRDCTSLPEGERTRIRLGTIGFVYQFHHLLPEFTALDNVALPQQVAGRSQSAARDRARDLLSHLGLGERVSHPPAHLSGGERQRVAIARALANEPRILLADEPTGNLDPATSTFVFDSLLELVRSTGVAALIATHNLELTKFMDRVFTIREGHLEQTR